MIRLRGARVNNLKNVDLDLPKRRLTVLTGVSGSGKSSLAFETIAAESRRLVNDTYSAFVQGLMPTNARPDVDMLEGLTAAIIVDQERLATNPRSTVGTVTDVNAYLRLLFSRLAEPHLGSPLAYSFNTPSVSAQGAMTVAKGDQKRKVVTYELLGGMCPVCEGRGTVAELDIGHVIDENLSLDEGAITVPGYKPGGWSVRYYSESGFIDSAKKIKDYTDQERHDLLYKEPTKVSLRGTNMTYEGLLPKVKASFLQKDRASMQPHIRRFVDEAVTFEECPDCGGTRLAESARTSVIDGLSIADVCAMQVVDLLRWVEGLDRPGTATITETLISALTSIIDIGLGYLTLEREACSLSGGEAQRIKMVKHLGSSLTDVTYVFDEPTAGLHPHDIDRMNDLLIALRDKGNTVIIVEHRPETIAIADHIVDLGPGAGTAGGEITYEGDLSGLHDSDTVTGRFLSQRVGLKARVRPRTGAICVRGAHIHNLKNVDVDIPLGVLTVITGVAGSGKSSLVKDSIPDTEGLVYIGQTPIRGSRRSNPATYTGLLDHIRKAFAKQNGVPASLFSPNSDGACQNCKGLAVTFVELSFLESVPVPCEVCGGERFQDHVLEHMYEGKNIADVLRMTVGEAATFYEEAKLTAAAAILDRLVRVGLGYLTLGQPLSTLSGGERQRLKLAHHLAEKGGIYVLDEPAAGLHLADIRTLLELFDDMVDSGISVIAIEHHQAVMAHADWVIDLGPGAGSEGGSVVFAGTPADLVAAGSTLTAHHLARYVLT
ncbi:ATP-binding cassette domain-containing protein [Flaviflexus huanghaiensis]|uniref:ATP-binding cassette domain-containing protein n=1 Tax=Flaviflexus huanghaiensis TaxID=1111473 RepID=UPI001F5126E0|nr:excinuclease ABC subunit UvrA [Flaviflexus huanghaiensis]